MTKLPIYTTQTSNRLTYILDWLFNEQLKTGYRLIHSEDEAKQEHFLFSYGASLQNAINIPDAGLLWQSNIKSQQARRGDWENVPTLYAMESSHHMLPFDIFSAIFFLLSRYEEYLNFTSDKHGRYPATDSVLFREGLLERPLVDEWIEKLRQLLKQKYSVTVGSSSFDFQASYDIDIAWSYKYKGVYRTAGAMVKGLLSGKISDVANRLKVLTGNAKDPYDSFEWLQQLHRQLGVQPIYFVLASLQTTPFDKNIHPEHPQMRELIARLAGEGAIGMHPSYYSGIKPQVFTQEKACLEKITGKTIMQSRQHYIKLKLPDTYRMLIAAHITDDYSMGYGTHPGFRAGTGHSFYWFDLQAGQPSALRVHPFCFMDTTALFDCGLDADTAFKKLQELATRLKNANSKLTTVFHNFSLGTDPQWTGWREAYASFLQKVISL